MYIDFKEINKNAVCYVKNIQNGIDIDKNFNCLLSDFSPIINSLVRSIKYNQRIDMEDLKQEAIISLWKCCGNYNFDMDNKASFYTYFYGCAFNTLTEYVYKYQTPIAVNKHEKERTKEMREYANQYYEKNGRYPDVDDYVNAGFSKKLSKRFYSYVLNANCTDFNLEEIEDDRNNISVEEEYEKKERNEELYNAINMLNDNQKTVIELSFFENLTNVEIAKRLNVTEAAVRKTKTKALEILKNSLGDYE